MLAGKIRAKNETYPKKLGTGGLPTDLGGSPAVNRCILCKSFGLLPSNLPSRSCELLDSFGESPSELPTRSHRIV
ncbi:hypothetical protein B296_00014830 [Ensete ventricosum]|uniref:Uncharacterized protein n=1 Tax=Ensete ventricosum TaxID=4639 RepID=A0A426Z3P5_ENSVE|nr:hypothetical protein B296_00014830 [Ensete ventricosum]